jgi:glutaredoxin-like protein
MAFLTEKDQQFVQNLFENMKDNVKLIMFTQELECMYCRETRQILEEVASLSDKIELTVYNFQVDKEMANKYNIDKIPATVVEGKKDYGIRYYGIPSGYEFSSLLDDIVDVSKNESGFSSETKAMLAKIDKPLHLQVFVTPTCPHCPKAVRMAHKAAIENDYITADMVEATEFPHLAMRYDVKGVPRTIIAEEYPIEGAVSEMELVERILEVHNSPEGVS